MQLKELIKDLEGKEDYQNFKKENPDAFFCSAMFVLGDADKIDLNFFIPNKNKISSFAMPYGKITNHPEEIKSQSKIENLDLKVDVTDLNESVKKATGKEFKKLIAVLLNDTWNVTCLDGLDMCRLNIHAYTGDAEKKDVCSLTDLIKFKKN